MDFALRREGFVEEEEDEDQIPNHHQHHRPMSFSSTSVASPSSSQYRSINFMNSNAEMGSWLGTRFDPKAVACDNLREPMSSSDHDIEPGDYASIEKEHMFDKVVTPSDVGKLNRLVIPKQYAEKYFPLDSSTNEKGLLLNFEDREGKPWRFRYSYWNSSQSYVMTKGWSRFVKEKKLDAGDTVSFQRGVGDAAKDRLFIEWRRRPDGPHDVVGGGHGGLMPGQYFRSIQYPWAATASAAVAFSPQQHLYCPGTVMMTTDRRREWGGPGYGYGNVVYLRSNPGALGPPPAVAASPIVFDSVPVVQGKAAAKRLRLFGVNMDCPVSESDEECEILSSTAISHVSMVSQPPNIQFSSSPTAMQQPYPIPQLRLFNGTPLMSSKGKQTSTSSSSSMSLDFDIN